MLSKPHVPALLMMGIAAGAHGCRTMAADSTPADRLPSANEVELVLPLPADDRPEGIAFDRSGRLFISNRRLQGEFKISEILRVHHSGSASVFATLETSGDPSAEGVLGLATDPLGGVYAAIVSFNRDIHGVWRIDRDGLAMARLRGSEDMSFPNALAFDPRGNLYVTDSVAGAVWRFSGNLSGFPWVQDPLLAPGDPIAPGLPPIGANGIAFVPPDSLFVANTEAGKIVRVRISPDGEPSAPELVARDFALASVDGLAADAHGNLHGVIPGFAVFGTNPLVRVDPDSGAIHQTATDPTAFHFPLSLAFGAGAWDHQSVFVTNGGPLFPVPGPGPGVVRAHIGIPGIP